MGDRGSIGSATSARAATSVAIAAAVAAVALALAGVALAQWAALKLKAVSSDPYANRGSYHATEVEPDTFSFSRTIVAAFQVGRFADGGAANIGWATSSNAGASWRHGFLPQTTAFSTPPGAFARESDPSVAYDAAHKTWLISGLALSRQLNGAAVIVSRSTDGGLTWNAPVTVDAASASGAFDKDWIACDNTSTSPHYGSCYAEWDDAGNGNQLHMAYSRDGGLTWSQSSVPVASVIGGQPVVQPSGRVVMPIDNGPGSALESFVSGDGGVSYTGPTQIAAVFNHLEGGGLRSPVLASAEVDGSGRVYVAWADCRFRASCSANDIVFSSSRDGTHWSGVRRIPIDATTSGVDHFIPGLGVAANSSGKTARLGLTYYFYPHARCNISTCQLDTGFVSSSDAGARWSAPVHLAGPMKLRELPLTSQGFMVGDYISTSLLTGAASDPALSVFAVGLPGTGTACRRRQVTSCNEPMEAPARSLSTALAGARSALTGPVLSSRSGHPANVRLAYH